MPLKTWDANCGPLSEIVMYVRILDVRLAFRLRLSVCCKAEHNNYSLCKSLIDHDKNKSSRCLGGELVVNSFVDQFD